MAFYFSLQYKRIIRWFEETGIHPLVGFLLLAIVFIGGSKFLFYKTLLAKWIYPVLATTFILKLSDQKRTNFLKIIFENGVYYNIRVIENTIIALPFLVYLVYENQFLIALGLMVMAIILAFFRSLISINWVIPTPFRKLPFEYIVGFRKSFSFIILIYFVTFQAILVDNFNLTLATLGALFLTGMSYYLKPEQQYFVWLFSDKPEEFLKRKIIASLKCSSVITLPVLVRLIIAFPDMYIYSIIVQVIGYIFLISIIVAKYSAYPHEMSVPQGILYALSLGFPPLLLIVIPIFYKQSKRKLDTIL